MSCRMFRCPQPSSSRPCEPLERRALLSVVTIDGTNGPDNFTVSLNETGDTLLVFDGPPDGQHHLMVFDLREVDGLVFNLLGNNDEVNVRRVPPDMPTTLNGGAGHDEFIVGGGAYDSFVRSPVTVNGDAGDDTLWFADTGTQPSASQEYRFTHDTFTKGAARPPTTFVGVEDVTLDGDPDHNYVHVDSVAPGVTVRVFGNFGGEQIHVGQTPDGLAALAGHVELMDGDRLNIYDTAAGADATFTIGAGVIGLPYHGATITYGVIRDMRLFAGGGDDTFNVTGHSFDDNFSIRAGDGDDTFNVGDPTLGIVMNESAFVGEGGHDVLHYNDQPATAPRSYALTNGTLTRAGSGANLYGTVEQAVLNAGEAADIITVRSDDDAAPAMTVHGGGGADAIDVRATVGQQTVTVDGGAARDVVLINGDSAGTAAVRFENSQDLAELRLLPGGRAGLAAGGAVVLLTELLTLDPAAGPLDLADNAAVIDYTGPSPLANVGVLLSSGYANGVWTGPGINSSAAAADARTAIGYAEAAEIFTSFPASFAGVNVDDTAVLLKHTFYGDADLSGNVNLQDFNRLAANFGQSARRWVHGDFDFDNGVNLPDFNRLAANFGATGLGPDARPGTAEELPSLEDLTRPARRAGAG